MAKRFDNRWRSFVIFLSVIGLVIQPILADNDNDGHGGIPGVPTELGASWPMKKPTPSPVQYKIEGNGSHPEQIIGGDVARPGDFPWMAITFRSGRQGCGGSLISEKHILTATHCFLNIRPSDVVVHLGDFDISTNDEVRHVERRVIKITSAPGYDSGTVINDVTILTMDAPVQSTPTIKPIPLASSSQLYTGRIATIAGWGCTEIAETAKTVLRQISVPIIPNAECKVTDSQMCTAHATKSVCEGDSGGPLVIKEGGKWIQIGVASARANWLDGQQRQNLFARVSAYLPWIHQNLK